MKKTTVFVSTLAFTVLFLVTPVMAVGPWQAEEVNDNPKFGTNVSQGRVFLDNKWNDRHGWGDRTMSVYLSASKGDGKMNSAIIADSTIFKEIRDNRDAYLNKWIYLSGESGGNTFNSPRDNPDVGSHSIFYWWVRASGYSHEEALDIASNRNPNGVFMLMVDMGPKE